MWGSTFADLAKKARESADSINNSIASPSLSMNVTGLFNLDAMRTASSEDEDENDQMKAVSASVTQHRPAISSSTTTTTTTSSIKMDEKEQLPLQISRIGSNDKRSEERFTVMGAPPGAAATQVLPNNSTATASLQFHSFQRKQSKATTTTTAATTTTTTSMSASKPATIRCSDSAALPIKENHKGIQDEKTNATLLIDEPRTVEQQPQQQQIQDNQIDDENNDNNWDWEENDDINNNDETEDENNDNASGGGSSSNPVVTVAASSHTIPVPVTTTTGNVTKGKDETKNRHNDHDCNDVISQGNSNAVDSLNVLDRDVEPLSLLRKSISITTPGNDSEAAAVIKNNVVDCDEKYQDEKPDQDDDDGGFEDNDNIGPSCPLSKDDAVTKNTNNDTQVMISITNDENNPRECVYLDDENEQLADNGQDNALPSSTSTTTTAAAAAAASTVGKHAALDHEEILLLDNMINSNTIECKQQQDSDNNFRNGSDSIDEGGGGGDGVNNDESLSSSSVSSSWPSPLLHDEPSIIDETMNEISTFNPNNVMIDASATAIEEEDEGKPGLTNVKNKDYLQDNEKTFGISLPPTPRVSLSEFDIKNNNDCGIKNDNNKKVHDRARAISSSSYDGLKDEEFLLPIVSASIQQDMIDVDEKMDKKVEKKCSEEGAQLEPSRNTTDGQNNSYSVGGRLKEEGRTFEGNINIFNVKKEKEMEECGRTAIATSEGSKIEEAEDERCNRDRDNLNSNIGESLKIIGDSKDFGTTAAALPCTASSPFRQQRDANMTLLSHVKKPLSESNAHSASTSKDETLEVKVEERSATRSVTGGDGESITELKQENKTKTIAPASATTTTNTIQEASEAANVATATLAAATELTTERKNVEVEGALPHSARGDADAKFSNHYEYENTSEAAGDKEEGDGASLAAVLPSLPGKVYNDDNGDEDDNSSNAKCVDTNALIKTAHKALPVYPNNNHDMEVLTQKFTEQIRRLEQHYNVELEEMKIRHDHEISVLQQEKHALQKKCENNNKEIASSSSSASTSYSKKDLNRLVEQGIAEYKKKLELMESKYTTLESQFSDLKKLNQLHKIDYNNEIHNMKANFKQKEEEIIKLRFIESTQNQQITSLKEEIIVVTKDRDDMKAQHESLRQRAKSVATELRDRRMECRNLSGQVETLEKTSADQMKQIAILEKGITAIKRSNADVAVEKFEYERRISELNTKIQALENEKTHEKKYGEHSLASYKAKSVKALKDANARAAIANSARESMQEELSNSKSLQVNMQSQLDDMEHELEQRLMTYTDKIKNLEKERSILESTVLSGDQKLEEMAIRLEDIIANKKTVSRELHDLQIDWEECQRVVAKETSANYDLARENSKLHEDCKRMSGEITLLKEEMDDIVANDGVGGGRMDGGTVDIGGNEKREQEGLIQILQEEKSEANEAIKGLKDALRVALAENKKLKANVRKSKDGTATTGSTWTLSASAAKRNINEEGDDISSCASSHSVSSDFQMVEKFKTASDDEDILNVITARRSEKIVHAESSSPFKEHKASSLDLSRTLSSTNSDLADDSVSGDVHGNQGGGTMPLFFAFEKQAELSTAKDEITRLATLLGDVQSQRMEAMEEVDKMKKRLETAEARLERQSKLLGVPSDPVSPPRGNTTAEGQENVRSGDSNSTNRVREEGAATANLEYLKHVMLRYMYAKTASERRTLLPVLSTILCLTPEEAQGVVRTIELSGGLQGMGSAFFESLESLKEAASGTAQSASRKAR